MNLLDGLIIVLLILAILRGIEIGFARQFFSAVGFFGGLFLGAWIYQAFLKQFIDTPAMQSIAILLAALGSGITLMTIGEYVGIKLKLRFRQVKLLNNLDRVAGAVLALGTFLIAIWLSAALFKNIEVAALQRQISGSWVIKTLNRSMPEVPDLVSKIGNFIDPNNFPKVFNELEPKLDTAAPLPDLGDLKSAVDKADDSTVKVQGRGCGGLVVGSGFVASHNLVVTNAHVVAGVNNPKVVDGSGVHDTQTVWFDPNLDLAILKVNNLSNPPLSLQTVIAANSSPAAVLGYPGGGGLVVKTAVVLDSFRARGYDIYDQNETERQIYSIKARVEQGNSGGPVINSTGEVIGVVFASSANYDDVSYAITASQVSGPLAEAATAPATGTGTCSAR